MPTIARLSIKLGHSGGDVDLATEMIVNHNARAFEYDDSNLASWACHDNNMNQDTIIKILEKVPRNTMTLITH